MPVAATPQFHIFSFTHSNSTVFAAIRFGLISWILFRHRFERRNSLIHTATVLSVGKTKRAPEFWQIKFQSRIVTNWLKWIDFTRRIASDPTQSNNIGFYHVANRAALNRIRRISSIESIYHWNDSKRMFGRWQWPYAIRYFYFIFHRFNFNTRIFEYFCIFSGRPHDTRPSFPIECGACIVCFRSQ